MKTLLLIINLAIIPLLLTGVIRKIKALMQTRIGAPLLQPFYDIAKLLSKSETISETASWIFIWAPRIGLAIGILTAAIVPWAGVLIPARVFTSTNFLLALYLMTLAKFMVMLAAMDTGSAFGGLGASREATIGLLVEPTMVLGLSALSLGAGNMDLAVIYSGYINPFVAILVGIAFVLASLAELSRIPVDDPTTHLELTMVHEAMILENSGPNLAITEYAVALRTCVLFGLATQTLLHILPGYETLPSAVRYTLSLTGLFSLGIIIAVAEGVMVKLKWRSVPNFLAFTTVLSLLAGLFAVALR